MLDRMNQDAGARSLRIFAIVCFLVFAACLRSLPHPWNFTPAAREPHESRAAQQWPSGDTKPFVFNAAVTRP
jgi:hypothetical protein